MRIVGRSLTEGEAGGAEEGSGAAETRTVGRSLTAESGAAGAEAGAMLFFPFAPLVALAPSLAP
jgi:hypothetical protein